MSCTLCDLGNKAFAQAMPYGSESPDMYLVFDKPTGEELRFMDPMGGARGVFLKGYLDSLGIGNYRAFYALRCPCEDKDYMGTAADECMKFLLADIYRTKPKVVVALGSFPAQRLLGTDAKISNIHGNVKRVGVFDETFTVVPVYSPTYVSNKANSSDLIGEFMADLATAAKIATGTYVNPMDVNVMEYALDYETFRRFYEENLRGEEMLAYDIETNAKIVYAEDFDICGWSLAKRGMGIYVCLDSLDYSMGEDDRELCIELLVKILRETPKIVVHNSLYERPATYYRYGYEMPFEKMEDTLVMAKIMLGGKVGAGLKPNARRIGYPEWDADVAEYISAFTSAVKRCSLKKFSEVVELMRQGDDYYAALRIVEDPEKYEEITGYFDRMRDVIGRYYDEDETERMMSLVSERFLEGFDGGWTGIIPYSWIPKRILCKYGATDSLATFDLYDHFMRRFDEDSTDEVDLHKGYYYDLMEHYTGYELMLAGIHWDDEQATRDYRAYTEMMLKTHRAMILCDHPAMNRVIVKSLLPQLAPPYIYEYYNDWFWDRYKRRVEMKGEDTYVMVDISPKTGKERRRATKFLFDDIDDIPETVMEDLAKRILPKAKEMVRDLGVSDLKQIFNPASTQESSGLLYEAIVMSDDLRVGHFINKVNANLVTSDEYNPNRYHPVERDLVEAIRNYMAIPVENVEERKNFFIPLRDYIANLIFLPSKDLGEYLREMKELRVNKFSEECQLEVFESLKTTPMDPDDPETWTEAFKWNFLLRVYKKSSKIISAYLDGTIGRKSVYAVDAERLHRGEDVVYREDSLMDLGVTDHRANLPAGKDWLEQTNFGVGTAETGRWRSAAHVVPTGSTVKRLLTSRFVGGTIFQPDFSANELRCVASMAHEESMLKAFREGMDIHRANAATMYGVPFEEVTPFQRRSAKAMSFAILYGGSEKMIADNYFKGDMVKAKEQLDSFYSAFPSLKSWIDSKREELQRTHKVSTMTDRFISIDYDPSDKQSLSRALRQAGNYPVQSFRRSEGVFGLDGKVHTIGELADNHEDLWVYSYDAENDCIVPVKGIQAQCTGTTDSWYEITLDNGRTVTVTPEHKMMLRDGTFVEACNLKVGQSLMPLYVERRPEDNRLKFHRGKLIQKWVHDSIYGDIPGTSVHHVNIDPDDNRPENLICLSNRYHVAYHRNFYEYLAGSKTFEDFISVVRPEIVRNYPDNYEERLEDIRRIVSEIPEDRKRELSERSMTSRNRRRSEDYTDWSDNQREAAREEVQRRLDETGNILGMDQEAFKARLSQSWAETRDYRMERLKEGHNSLEARKHHSEAAKKQRNDPEYVFKSTRRMLGYFIENNLPWHTIEDWDASAKLYPKAPGRRYSRYILGLMDWDEFIRMADDFAASYNHKIVGIRVIHLDEPEPKYDLHVPKYHNFALSCGVFTHNSSASTMAAVVFCDILLYMKKMGFKSKGICFIHDSLESDVAPFELLEIIKYQQGKLATGAVDYFGIECKADVSMGFSMGHECEMPEIEILDDEHTKAYITLTGFYDDILDTINNWKRAYHRVDIVEEDLEDQYLSISEMFIARKAFDPTCMNHHKTGKVKVYVQYYNDHGEIDPMDTDFEPINIWDNCSVYQYVKALEI